MNTIKSRILTLSKSDLVNGLIIAVFGTVTPVVEQMIVKGGLSAIDWHLVATVAVSATLIYLEKKLVTNSDGQVLGIKASQQ